MPASRSRVPEPSAATETSVPGCSSSTIASDAKEIVSERGLKGISEVGEEFYERPSQKVGLSLEHSTRYARHVSDVLGIVVPEEDLGQEYRELSERVLPDPQYYGS